MQKPPKPEKSGGTTPGERKQEIQKAPCAPRMDKGLHHILFFVLRWKTYTLKKLCLPMFGGTQFLDPMVCLSAQPFSIKVSFLPVTLVC
jgi:hypothetical protein